MGKNIKARIAAIKKRQADNPIAAERVRTVATVIAAIPCTGPGTSGSIACPLCDGGRVNYVFSSVNGHLHAGCTTPNCFAIME